MCGGIVWKIIIVFFESVILYLHSVLSSLIVIPMILMAKSLKRVVIGFIADF